MSTGYALLIVHKLIILIVSEFFDDNIRRLMGFNSELEEYSNTVVFIRNVLLDAEDKRDLSVDQRRYVSDLVAALYDADDLFDEIFTLAKFNNEFDGNKRGKFSYDKKKSSQAKQMPHTVLKIRKWFDAISEDCRSNILRVKSYTPNAWRPEEPSLWFGDPMDKMGMDGIFLDPRASYEKINILDPSGEKRNILDVLYPSASDEKRTILDPISSRFGGFHYDLTYLLKSCFTYCSVFPKDFEMDKETLISLWVAQGYKVPLFGNRTIEDAAEESFLILLDRYFFKDVKTDKWGGVKSVRLHDFMHDFALKMSAEETCVVSSRITNLEKKLRHVYVNKEYEGHLTCNPRIRSYFSRDLTDKQVEDMRALRALALCSPCLSLPSSLDNLLLLRFIKLESGNLVSLPDSITRLYNLQTLILHCIRLRELPIDIGNLINLRHLDISPCASLIGIPLSMEKLTNLAVLPCFVVGYGDSNAELKILQAFTKIKRELHIKIRKIYENVDGVSETEGINLKNMKHISYLNIEIKDHCIDQEDVLKKLQLPPNLKGLTLQWYKGTTIPWLSQVSFNPDHLVRIEIIQCHKLEQLPVLSKLPNLKSLFLDMLNSVEYLEEVNSVEYLEEVNSVEYLEEVFSSGKIEVAEFFPSLESLEIRWMSKLIGWWKGNEIDMRLNAFPRLSFLSMAFCPEFTSFTPDNFSELHLPCLRELHIERCGKFASNLVCPRLEKLNLNKINENLLITCENSQVDVVIKNRVNDLKSVRTFCLTGLTISNCIDWEVKSFSEFKKKFEKSCCSSLLTLVIEDCEFIRRLSGLEHLTVLQELTLDYNQQLIINEDDEEPWKSFHRSLRKLKFSSLRRMKSLPKGMQHLNFLEHLVLHDCKNLEGLPQWLSRLSSLKSMEIYECPGIKSFPEAIKDLFSLDNLSIYDCPDLEKSCREDYEKIKNISYEKPSREEFFLRR